MGSFRWEVEGEVIDIIFSLIRNGRWVDEDLKNAVVFDYLANEMIMVGDWELDLEDSEYDRDLWQMLLQVTNLDAT